MDILTRAEMLQKIGLPPEVDGTAKMMSGVALEMYLESLPEPDEFFEIDPVARLYLLRTGTGNREAFAECFQAVWRQIPPAEQVIMADFWRTSPAVAGSWNPTIELVGNLSLVGKYDSMSHHFGFNSQVTDMALADDLLSDLIGHELGHAWHHHIPNSWLNKADAQLWKETECEADAKASAWGFDMQLLRGWSNAKRNHLWTILNYGGTAPDNAFLVEC